MFSVVGPDGWAWLVGGKSVEEADGVGLAHAFADLVSGEPRDAVRLGAGVLSPAGEVAPEDEGDDPAGHVLVDAGQSVGFDQEPGFFLDLAP